MLSEVVRVTRNKPWNCGFAWGSSWKTYVETLRNIEADQFWFGAQNPWPFVETCSVRGDIPSRRRALISLVLKCGKNRRSGMLWALRAVIAPCRWILAPETPRTQTAALRRQISALYFGGSFRMVCFFLLGYQGWLLHCFFNLFLERKSNPCAPTWKRFLLKIWNCWKRSLWTPSISEYVNSRSTWTGRWLCWWTCCRIPPPHPPGRPWHSVTLEKDFLMERDKCSTCRMCYRYLLLFMAKPKPPEFKARI